MMVTERAVIGAVLLIFTPSSSKNPPLELITVVTVTPPVPVWTGAMVSAIVVVALRLPLVPVIVTVVVPVVAVLDAVKVRVLEVVVEAGLKLAVTPVGNALVVNATVPLNPFTGVTLMVLLPLVPWFTVSTAGLAARVKLG